MRDSYSRSFLGVVVMITALVTAPVAATLTMYWQKSEVLAVVMVRPGIYGFVPVEGSSIGNAWSKDDVVPMCLVRPSMTGFVPIDGSTIGNSWDKDEVKAFVEVLPSGVGFEPKGEVETAPCSNDSRITAQPSAKYSDVGVPHSIAKVSKAGDEVELDDGSIWQVPRAYRIQTVLWLPTTKVSVTRLKTPIGDYHYALKTDEGDTVFAKFLIR